MSHIYSCYNSFYALEFTINMMTQLYLNALTRQKSFQHSHFFSEGVVRKLPLRWAPHANYRHARAFVVVGFSRDPIFLFAACLSRVARPFTQPQRVDWVMGVWLRETTVLEKVVGWLNPWVRNIHYFYEDFQDY